MVGLTTDLKTFPDGTPATFDIYAKALVKFLNGAIGESSGPFGVDQGKP